MSLGRASVWRSCSSSEVLLSPRFSWVSVYTDKTRCNPERLRNIKLHLVILESISQRLHSLWSEFILSKIEVSECLWNKLKLDTEETKTDWTSLYYFAMHQPNIALLDLESHFHRDQGWWESRRSSKNTITTERAWQEDSPYCSGRHQLDVGLLRHQCNCYREGVWWVSKWKMKTKMR